MKKLKIVAMVAVMAVAFISVLEQNPGWVADYEGNKERWNSDKTFMAEVENVMDSGDKIYQLPYQSFPESVEQNNMNPLEQLTGFIHSRNLRWSYGTMPDSHEDKWYRETSDLSVQTMVEEIQLKGFDGIYINRTGYEEEELGKLEEELSNLLNEKPIISDDKRLSFFKIR